MKNRTYKGRFFSLNLSPFFLAQSWASGVGMQREMFTLECEKSSQREEKKNYTGLQPFGV